MDQLIKKNIRLLTERFNHSIEYSAEDLWIKSDLNSIKISPKHKYGFVVAYNSESNIIQIEIKLADIYDILIQLLRRTQPYGLKEKTGKLLSIADWITEEGDWVVKELKVLKNNLDQENLEFKEIGGNRFKGEYFKGLLILTDDLCWGRSNVFAF
jgi:hypothetical protein